MARKSIEIISCDRCGLEIDAPHRGGEAGTFSARFSSDYAVAGSVVLWEELCAPCNGYLGNLFDTELEKAKALKEEYAQ